MKNLILIFVISFSFVACSSSDNELENHDQSIIGTWQLVEVIVVDDELNPIWVSVEDGYKYTFYKNGQFSSTRFSECSLGKYSLKSGFLILNFTCEGFTTEIETPPGTFKEEIRFKANYMILKPTYLSCIEGCGNKFKKID